MKTRIKGTAPESGEERVKAAEQVKIEDYHAKMALGQKLHQAIKDDKDDEAVQLINEGADFFVVVNEEFEKNHFRFKNETALTLAIGLAKPNLCLK